MTTEYLLDLITRICIAYKASVPEDCPPSPHACDKCEIHFLLQECYDDKLPWHGDQCGCETCEVREKLKDLF